MSFFQRHLSLSWTMLLREWRGGEMTLLFAALTLGVAIVTGISLFAERLQGALVGEASVYLGADRVLESSEPITQDWINHAHQQSLRTARTAVFPTMIYRSDNSGDERTALASLKAVSDSYPLRGQLDSRDKNNITEKTAHGPTRGTAWIDANILSQLDIQPGDRIDVGDLHLVAERILLHEGDAGSSFYGMGARVMINDADLPASGLVLPGSRVEYRYLFAGDEKNIASFFDWLKPQLTRNQRVIGLQDNQPGIAGALDKAALFLQLAGSLGVLLAALAAGFSAQRYCERHTDAIAVMKTLGAQRTRLLGLLAGQMGWLWLIATATGFLCGELLQHAFLQAMASWVPASLPAAGFYPFFIGGATSFICLLTFVLPAFWRLQAVPPWRVLRSDNAEAGIYQHSLLLALPGIAVLLFLYSQQIKMVGLLVSGLLTLILPAGVLGFLLLRGGRALSMQAGSMWRLGIANVLRRRWLSLLQIIVFGISFMLLAVMILLRTSLLSEWKLQLPVNAPNVFLINIAPQEVDGVRSGLQDIGIATPTLYPMVRGRLARINDHEATELFDATVTEVYREINLSWSDRLPVDNQVVAGNWHGQQPLLPQEKYIPVSIEKGLAERLHLQLGDHLQFTIGDAQLDATISSIRSLQWDKMTPNFFFLFPPGALDHFNATWMTSVHRDAQQAVAMAKMLRRFPSITTYPIDDLVKRIQTIVDRASIAVQVILVLVLAAGLLVLLTCLRASIDQRLHESALLRTLGAGKKLIAGSLAVEFVFLGLSAGILAAGGAELTAWALQTQLFRMNFVPHPWLWFGVPALSTLVVGFTGTVFCYRAVRVPPMLILRESGYN